MDEVYPNETIKILHERASVRNFSEKMIEPDVLENILKAAVHGPSGGNLQPWSIIKIENKETSKKLGDMCHQKFIAKAPVNLLFCMDLRRNERLAERGFAPYSVRYSFRHFWISFQDTVIAAQNICNAADSYSIGSCYIGTIMEFYDGVARMFELPQGVYPVVLLCLGYTDNYPKSKNKFGIKYMVHNEKYKDTDIEDLWNAYIERENNQKIELNNERLKIIEEVCINVHGEKYAENVVKYIREKGYINSIQHRFGLHYRADNLPEKNIQFMDFLEKAGFFFFNKYDPELTKKNL